ncbi:hypothetical protein ACFV6E_35090 [Streptomyces sp. NPDC059785]|uniref:hypothetical protein n=1 Tax=unclassified Streptomyces TaxID=2593676 RepID=UPI00364CF774
MAVAVVAALGFTAACGGSDDKGGESKKSPTKESTQGTDGAKNGGASKAAAPLTKAELDKAALADGEVDKYKVEKTPASDLLLASVPASPAACQPIADMFLFSTDPTASAGAGRTLNAENALDASVTSLALFSYASGGAEEVLSGLRTATGKCTAYEHTGYKYEDVKALKDPGLGDESVSYRLLATIEGAAVPATYTVVRVGSVVVSFSSMDMLEKDVVEIPKKIIDAQLAKVKKATA